MKDEIKTKEKIFAEKLIKPELMFKGLFDFPLMLLSSLTMKG